MKPVRGRLKRRETDGNSRGKGTPVEPLRERRQSRVKVGKIGSSSISFARYNTTLFRQAVHPFYFYALPRSGSMRVLSSCVLLKPVLLLGLVCGACGTAGHLTRDCKNPRPGFASMGGMDNMGGLDEEVS